MAVTKIPENLSFSIEVRKGTDKAGEALYGKKSFSGLKNNVEPSNVLSVANALCEVIDADTRNCFLNTVDSLVEA